MATFVKTTWIDNSDPAITAAQLNRMEAGIYDAVYKWAAGTLAARPPASAAQQNHGYFATDDNGGTAYICFDGAAWTKIAPGLSAAGGGAATWAFDAEVTAVTFADVTGLVGDTDLAYEVFVDGVLTTGGVARNLTVRPNNLTATTENTYSAVSRSAGSLTVGSYDSAGLFIGYTTTVDSAVGARGLLFAKTGRTRKWLGNAQVSQIAAPTQTLMIDTAGRWDDTTTGLTSVRVDFGGGSFTGRVRVRKV